jgi:hypothetical protein
MISTDQAIEDALQQATDAARRAYVRAGLSMPVWRRGMVVWIEPSELARYAVNWSRRDPASTTPSSASGGD